MSVAEATSVDPSRPFWEPWYRGKQFTNDWSSRAFPAWVETLSHLKPQPLRILEIGSWEGRSAVFFLEFFPNSTITCMDIFMPGHGDRFDENVLRAYPGRCTKLSTRSTQGLDILSVRNHATFDLIYIDGSHDRDDVMIDSILAWRLLAEGGILIWDDYKIEKTVPEGTLVRDQIPYPAIDAFMEWRSGEFVILHSDYQVIVQKTKPHFPHMPLDPLAPAPKQSFLRRAARKVRRTLFR